MLFLLLQPNHLSSSGCDVLGVFTCYADAERCRVMGARRQHGSIFDDRRIYIITMNANESLTPTEFAALLKDEVKTSVLVAKNNQEAKRKTHQ